MSDLKESLLSAFSVVRPKDGGKLNVFTFHKFFKMVYKNV